MEVITLAIAAAGLALACLSLGWQAASFLLAGPRVKTKLKWGYRGPPGAVLWEPKQSKGLYDLDPENRHGLNEQVLAIEVRNVGRLAVSVDRWQAKFESGLTFYNPNDPLNPRLPYRLEAGTSETWYAEGEEVRRIVSTSQGAGLAQARGEYVWMEVELGNGKTVSTRERILVSERK